MNDANKRGNGAGALMRGLGPLLNGMTNVLTEQLEYTRHTQRHYTIKLK